MVRQVITLRRLFLVAVLIQAGCGSNPSDREAPPSSVAWRPEQFYEHGQALESDNWCRFSNGLEMSINDPSTIPRAKDEPGRVKLDEPVKVRMLIRNGSK